MATPVGHSLAALSAWTAFSPRAARFLASPWLWLALLSANAPDLDFLPGMFLGDESLYHRSAGHSIGGAAVYGVLVFAAAFLTTGRGRTAGAAGLAGLFLFGSHLLLDLVTSDPGAPFGIQLFWPFSREFHIAPLSIFPHLDRHPFDLSVVGRALPVAAIELAIFLPLLAAAVLRRRRRPFP